MNVTREEKVYLNNIATRSFRDVADQDYIAARLCYRSNLMVQFVWMAEQAIEKYLKAILVPPENVICAPRSVARPKLAGVIPYRKSPGAQLPH